MSIEVGERSKFGLLVLLLGILVCKVWKWFGYLQSSDSDDIELMNRPIKMQKWFPLHVPTGDLVLVESMVCASYF